MKSSMRQVCVKEKQDRTRLRSDLLVEDRKRITSHRPKTIFRIKTEEGSRQSEAKETIKEKKEHANVEMNHHTVNQIDLKTISQI